ncbi:Hypothetical protein SRAE_2000465100 [Strongyloides ratti]|uniref:Uncharacterized protein n=1 Tax=Strongyloides ratti TaxID=34506 RepID=A0A090LJW7_STRRB|nr:Hypothetical protein SRAE_2000465100 [Strongyloides ratti]CEF70008.1 Hypothetical protein SRAE_2000465100 [Strongyloides ratti]
MVNVFKNKKNNDILLDGYTCEIKQFPSKISPESAEFEILQSTNGTAYIALTLIKIDNISTNWKEFQDQNRTIDIFDL